jgi:hypothetical protein
MAKQLDELRQNPDEGVVSVIITFEAGDAIVDSKDIYQLYFIEDIFAPSMTGKLQFVDKYGITELGPFTGNEKIIIVFGTESDKFQVEFDIFKIKKVENLASVDGIMSVLEIYFIDQMYYFMTQKKYSRAWQNSTISEIVQDICTYMLKETSFNDLEASRELLTDFYMPYWTPKEAISWLMKRASGAVTRNAGYVFYKTLRGLNFVTLDKLLGGKPINNEQYTQLPSQQLFDKYKILGWSTSGYNSLALKGIKGGKKFGFSSDTKSFVTSDNTYSEMLQYHTLLGRHSLFPDISDNTAEVDIPGDGDELILDNIFYSDFVKRYSKQNILEITVRGTSANYAGGIIDIDWPSSNPQLDRSNKLLKGYALIKSVTHSFGARQRPLYTQKLVLIKNAFTSADVGRVIPLVKASKTNISGVSGIVSKKVVEAIVRAAREVVN